MSLLSNLNVGVEKLKAAINSRTAKWALISTLITFLLLYADGMTSSPLLVSVLHLNNRLVSGSVSISHALPAIIIAMMPGLIAVALAMTLSGEREKATCLSKLDSKIDLDADIPSSFPVNPWLNSPEGVWIYYLLSELALMKVGLGLGCTVAGAALYLYFFGQLELWVAIAAFILAYLLLIYQNLIRWCLGNILK